MTNAELVRHIDAIAFEEGPSPEAKLIRIQNCLYQVDQANTANSIRADEYINNNTVEQYDTPNMRRC